MVKYIKNLLPFTIKNMAQNHLPLKNMAQNHLPLKNMAKNLLPVNPINPLF